MAGDLTQARVATLTREDQAAARFAAPPDMKEAVGACQEPFRIRQQICCQTLADVCL